jgi:2-methylcitrate dehydratase PrpD
LVSAVTGYFEGKFNVFGAFANQYWFLDDQLGKRFSINELAIKRYACCAFLHPGLDGLEKIMAENGLQAEEIEAIRLRFPSSGVALIDNNPLRSHCGQYIIPIYALERKIIIDDILIDRRGEPAIDMLSRKVQVLGDDELDPEFPDRYTTIIEVDSRGQTYKQLVRYAKGCPENPLTKSELQEKFQKLAGSVIETKVNELVEAVNSCVSASSIDHLVDLQLLTRTI